MLKNSNKSKATEIGTLPGYLRGLIKKSSSNAEYFHSGKAGPLNMMGRTHVSVASIGEVRRNQNTSFSKPQRKKQNTARQVSVTLLIYF